MDTKWNNTTETVEIEPVMPQRKGTGLRAAAAFLTFFLGVSLTLGSLCGAVGRLAIGSDYAEWWQNDWQETPVFRNRISNDLESFLAIGVGRTVDWYHPDYSVEDTVSGTGTIWFFADTPTASCEFRERTSLLNHARCSTAIRKYCVLPMWKIITITSSATHLRPFLPKRDLT